MDELFPWSAHVRFEPAASDDAQDLVEMVRAFHSEEGRILSPASEAAVARIAQHEPLAHAWIVHHGAETVGYLVLTIGYSIEYGGRDGFIDDLYLKPAFRGRGIGPKLLEFAVREAGALGINTLHLEVDPENSRAEALYKAAGFEETGRRLMRLGISPAKVDEDRPPR